MKTQPFLAPLYLLALLNACSGDGASRGALDDGRDNAEATGGVPGDANRGGNPGGDEKPQAGINNTPPAMSEPEQPAESPDLDPPDTDIGRVYALANGCYVVRGGDRGWLSAASDGEEFAFVTDEAQAARFALKAADLGSYLLYDQARGYLAAEDGPMLRQLALLSDISLLDDAYVSGAEWQPLPAGTVAAPGFRFRHPRSGGYLGAEGLVASEGAALQLTLEAVEGCSEHPELSVDAQGQVMPRTFADGSVYGIVDTHSHLLSNFGFGGGGIFHGAPFHRLGVEHALADCEPFHGKAGRKDIFGYGFNGGGSLNAQTLLPLLLFGELGQDDHRTAGYPDFLDWPNAPTSSTHQTQYYRWLERAYLSGLRLVIQHATSNEVICDFMVGEGYQNVRYSCNDMVAVDRILEETRNMERYIDAQAGGPGKGFFRIVASPAEAREVISAGKMAVVLGIETSNLFDCFSVPHAGMPTCNEQYVREQLDAYYARGVRALFPVHKYDNAFSAGDGHRDFIELGNFINSGHWSNFVQDCPTDVSAVFDKGDVAFGGLNEPRDDYSADPPNDMSRFRDAPVRTLAPHLGRLTGDKLRGDYCQNAGLTQLGETLLREMMLRGMVIEVDHFPRRSYRRALELLEESDYPAAGTHGSTQNGRLYALGGISKSGLGRCRSASRKGAMLEGLERRVTMIAQAGGYPAEGFGFDLNGFAGAPGPRFGERSDCKEPQQDPVRYPFTSYAGDVTFSEPRVGNRTIDFNTEGFVHIGMLPELIQDARADAESDADLEPLFRSAEGYLRMWERAEERAKQL